MNIADYDLSLFVESSYKTFKIELPLTIPPYLPNKDVFTSKEYVMTNLFRYLRSFNNMLVDARKEANINKLFEFPKLFTIDNYKRLLEMVSYEDMSIVTTWVQKIKKNYSLLDNWDVSITTLILTHHMSIPEPLSAINYYIPISEQQKKKEEEDRKGRGFGVLLSSPSLIRTWDVISHPAIYFSAHTSSTKLINWIRKNRKLIKLMNDGLDRELKTSSKMSIRTLRIGEATLITHWGGIKRWRDISKAYDDWNDKIDEDDDYEYWGEAGVPTSEEFRTGFNSYYSIVKNLDSGKFES